MPSRQIRVRLGDIKENIARIRLYTAELDEASFIKNSLVRDAVERCLERIAEAARKIGPALDPTYPELKLPNLRRFGSVLRHDCHIVDPGIVWRTIQERLDALDRMCERELSR